MSATSTPPPAPAESTSVPAPSVTEQKPPAPPQSPVPPLNNAFSEIDKLFEVNEPPKPVEKPKEQPKEQPKKPEPKPTDKPKEDAKVGDEKQPEESPKAEGKGGHVASLREAYETAKRRISDLEEKLNAPREDPERKALSEKYESAAKRIAQLEAELKDTAYERTDEYKQQFEQPIINAFKNAYADVVQLEVELEDGSSKKLTNEDFNAILQMPLGQATREASKLGPAAATVLLQHRQHILSLNNARSERLEAAKQQFAQRQQATREMSDKERTTMVERWKSTNEEAVKKYPQFFAPEDGDDEGNTLLQKGYEIADMMFSGRDMTLEEKVNLHAAIRNKAAGFDRMVYRNRKLSARIKELETSLEEFKKSEPSDEGSHKESPPREKTWQDEFDELVKTS